MSIPQRPARIAAIFSIGALGLAACGGATDDGADPAADSPVSDEQELLPITVGSLPIVPTVGLWYGVDQGIFEDYGLDVTVNTGVASETMVAATVAGEVDFVSLNTVALMIALDAGVPVQVTTGFSQAWEDGDEDISAVLALPDSGITETADLAGALIAVNTLQSAGTLSMREALRNTGGDPEDLDFVELPFPEMLRALEAGDVDAMWAVEPFITIAEGSGAQVVSWNFIESAPGNTTQVMVTAADQDPDMVERFNAALTDVLDAADSDEERLRELLIENMEMDPGLAERVRIERFSTDLDVATFADLVHVDGYVSEPVDLEAFDPAG